MRQLNFKHCAMCGRYMCGSDKKHTYCCGACRQAAYRARCGASVGKRQRGRVVGLLAVTGNDWK